MPLPKDRWILVHIKSERRDGMPPLHIVKWSDAMQKFDTAMDFSDETCFPGENSFFGENEITEWFELPKKGTGNAL
jgi:hypothetical protein